MTGGTIDVLVYSRRHPVRTLAILGALSLALHAATLMWLQPFAPKRATLGQPAGTTPAVKIRVVEAPRATPVTSPSRPAAAPARPAARGNSRTAVTASTSAAPSTYTDLLPTGAWHAERIGNGTATSTGTNVGIAPKTKAAIDELSSRLDIPLFARTKGGTARAVAKLLLAPDGSFSLAYLDGDPLLRACLHAALSQKSNLDVLARLMRAEERTEFVISFVHEESIAANLSRSVDDFRLGDGRLTIARTTYQPLPTSGMPLPDAHQKRAERRDRAQLDRLMDSPAYHSPLRDRRLP
jgi:hypothetical protein